MQRLLTGLQPSGALHIGNYFGALKPFVDLYGDYESSLLVVDYHALTTLKNPEELRQNIVNVVKDYLAVGVDPKRATIFKQSDVPEHTELAWIFETLVTVPFLMQAHAYKDKVAKGLEANAGLFNYPMLMAADILIQDADAVPVGQDQRQHIEISRDTAEKFNRIFGDTFQVPVQYILENVATVPGIDGQKMSKSYNNTIPLFATDEEIEKAVLSIVTDSGTGKPENVYAIHALFREKKELDELYSEKQGKYKELKEALIEDMKSFIRPLREKRAEFEKDKGRVLEIIKQGGEVARQRAEKKMEKVRERVGFVLKQ